MKHEIHLFLLWENSLKKYDLILKDLSSKFKILAIYNCKWNSDNFNTNLSRFYGKNLPKNCKKELVTGKGPFKIIIILDQKPLHDFRITSRGKKLVNVNVFDSKMQYRALTLWNGKIESNVHASNDINEAKHDILLLTGNHPNYYVSISNTITQGIYCMAGENGWSKLSELFSILNELCNYVVLRNFENFINMPLSALHTDIDILTDDYSNFVRISNLNPTTPIANRVQNSIEVEKKLIKFDIRFVGDNYMDKNWEKDILFFKKFSDPNKIFIPDEKRHFYSLLYHALVHKPNISPNYLDIFEEYLEKNKINIETNNKTKLIELLSYYLEQNNYAITIPSDPSVGFHYIPENYKDKYVIFRRRKKITRIKEKLRRLITNAK